MEGRRQENVGNEWKGVKRNGDEWKEWKRVDKREEGRRRHEKIGEERGVEGKAGQFFGFFGKFISEIFISDQKYSLQKQVIYSKKITLCLKLFQKYTQLSSQNRYRCDQQKQAIQQKNLS